MFYAIKKDGKYLATGGQYVNQSGLIGDGSKTPIWVEGQWNGFGTSILDHAKAIASLYGGSPVVVKS
jgi:hypothetical protein